MLCLLTSNKFYQLYFFYVKLSLPMGLAYDMIFLFFLFLRLGHQKQNTQLKLLFII
jgi:hypothetical protein